MLGPTVQKLIVQTVKTTFTTPTVQLKQQKSEDDIAQEHIDITAMCCKCSITYVFSERDVRVTFVRPTEAVEIFGNICTELGTLAIH